MTKTKAKVGRPTKYPWSRWFTRKTTVTIQKGVDFDCEVHSMAIMVRQKASRLGLTLAMSVKGDTIKFKVVQEPDNDHASSA